MIALIAVIMYPIIEIKSDITLGNWGFALWCVCSLWVMGVLTTYLHFLYYFNLADTNKEVRKNNPFLKNIKY
jgi:hypothetical protein